jgi:superfamily II DNA or RNA helicase
MINYSEFCLKDLTLRDYQQEAKEKIFSQWNSVDNILYQMPTGTGKTRLFTSIIRDINLWGLKNGIRFRILIIAHRSELIEQSSRSLSKYHIRHGVLAGNMKNLRDLSLPIQVASIQTITHPSNLYLLKDLSFDFIIIDEAHHAIANSYKKLWDFCPQSKKLGVTATPWRMNNCGFKQIFDAYIPSISINGFIQRGWLSPYQYYSIPKDSELIKSINSITDFDIDGDYKSSALIDVMDNNHIRAQLYDSYQRLAYGKKGIIYSISRAHSEHICAQYRFHGVHIENIDSKTPPRMRERIIKQFKDGNIDIIVNVDIFSEGFDCPDIEFIQLARPTRSLVKYIQQVGRGLRKNGDKRCIILDNVGMYAKFGLPDVDRDWKSYFEGEEIQTSNSRQQSSASLSFHNGTKIDTREGNEEMILIQDSVSEIKEVKDFVCSKAPLEVHVGSKVQIKSFSIRSKKFLSGKYVIEENEDGFFLCNVRNKQRSFLIKRKTFPNGVIDIKRGDDKSTFIIYKETSFTNVGKINDVIIGYIHKEGLIVKFTSFDRTIVNKNVSI